MSRVKCPHCGTRMVATTHLRQFDWSAPEKYKNQKSRKKKFDHARAEELFLGGLSLAAIAQQMGVTVPAVDEILRKRGVK